MAARIPIAGPWITEKEIRYVSEAVADGWYDNSAKYQTRFEEAFTAFAGRRHAISLPSCTSGLHLALLALGVGPGDRSSPRRHLDRDLGLELVGASRCSPTSIPRAGHHRRERRGGAHAEDQGGDRGRLHGNMPDLDPILTCAASAHRRDRGCRAEAAGATTRPSGGSFEHSAPSASTVPRR